jgi:hypothetical protein
MKNLIFQSVLKIALLLLSISSVAQAEDLLVIEYKAAKNSPATRQWISAAGETIYSINYRLQTTGRQVLYCPPDTMRLMTENYITILELEIARQGKSEMIGIYSVADILLDGLMRTFPCKK